MGGYVFLGFLWGAALVAAWWVTCKLGVEHDMVVLPAILAVMGGVVTVVVFFLWVLALSGIAPRALSGG